MHRFWKTGQITRAACNYSKSRLQEQKNRIFRLTKNYLKMECFRYLKDFRELFNQI